MLSLAHYLYRNTSDYESPDWSAIEIVKDVKIPQSAREADFSTRGGGGFEATEPTLQALSFEFNIVKDPDDENYAALLSAYQNRTAVDLWASDFAEDDSENTPEGQRAVCKIVKFDEGQALADGVMIDVVAKPCYAPGTPPSWHTVTP